MVAANNAALKDRPKALDRICADCADNVLTGAMIDGLVIEALQRLVDEAPILPRVLKEFLPGSGRTDRAFASRRCDREAANSIRLSSFGHARGIATRR